MWIFTRFRDKAPAPVRLVDFDDEPVRVYGNRWAGVAGQSLS
jgi:hypothetical protein